VAQLKNNSVSYSWVESEGHIQKTAPLMQQKIPPYSLARQAIKHRNALVKEFYIVKCCAQELFYDN